MYIILLLLQCTVSSFSVEDIARLFQWAVKLSLEAKQVHQSVTSLKQLMREKTGEEALDASEAKVRKS